MSRSQFHLNRQQWLDTLMFHALLTPFIFSSLTSSVKLTERSKRMRMCVLDYDCLRECNVVCKNLKLNNHVLLRQFGTLVHSCVWVPGLPCLNSGLETGLEMRFILYIYYKYTLIKWGQGLVNNCTVGICSCGFSNANDACVGACLSPPVLFL